MIINDNFADPESGELFVIWDKTLQAIRETEEKYMKILNADRMPMEKIINDYLLIAANNIDDILDQLADEVL